MNVLVILAKTDDECEHLTDVKKFLTDFFLRFTLKHREGLICSYQFSSFTFDCIRDKVTLWFQIYP